LFLIGEIAGKLKQHIDFGKLFIFWLKPSSKVKCVKFCGNLSTVWLNFDSLGNSLSSNIIISTSFGKFTNSSLNFVCIIKVFVNSS